MLKALNLDFSLYRKVFHPLILLKYDINIKMLLPVSLF